MDAIGNTIETAQPATADAAKASETVLTQVVRWRVPVVAHASHAHAPRNPSLPTFVGLIMLILTFFIVLTSISLHDKSKSSAAIASVQQAFGAAVTTEDVPAKKDEEIARDYIEGLTRRIQSLVPLMGGKKGPAADRQVLWLPMELVFPGEGATTAPLFPTILREVINALGGIPERLVPAIEMRLCATTPSDQIRARAVAIGAALAGEKAPLARFSVGIADCDPSLLGIAIALAPSAEPAQ